MGSIDPDTYINGLLGPACATAAKNDVPNQLPASIMIAMALQECGFEEKNFGQWNVFNIRYSSSISTKGDCNGWCGFNDINEACQGYIKNMKAGLYDQAISVLKPTLPEDTPEIKLQYFSLLLPIYAPASDNNNHATYMANVVSFINDYDLFKFDDPAQAGKKIDDALASKIAANMGGQGSSPKGKGKYGVGFDCQRHGKIVTITRLPRDSTNPCEPIYPDLLTVSDKVPQWVLDQTVVEVNAQAEAEALKKKTDKNMKEILGNGANTMKPATEAEKRKKFNEEYDKFSKKQFDQWLIDNGHGYDGTEEAYKKCKKLYEQAVKAGGDAFVDGIYVGKSDDVKKKAIEYAKQKKAYADEDAKKANAAKTSS